MAGNVAQWNEESIAGFERGLTGGSFEDGSNVVLSTFGELSDGPNSENMEYGFRLASVPEPSTLALAALAGMSLIGLVWRRRRNA